MIYLDVNKINERAPYQVEKLDEMSFMFTTKYGYHYMVGFAPDYSFLEDGAYQFYLVEKDHCRGRSDTAILETAIVVIEEFFRVAPGIMLYICDATDRLHAVRNRLFQYWFSTYPNNHLYVLATEQVLIDDNMYYAGLIISKTHPQLGIVIQSFHDFIQSLPEKL